MKKVLLFFIALFVLYSLAVAQMADVAELQTVKEDYLGLKPVDKPSSLIDLSRVKWSQSYSIAFFSGGGTSGSMGMYTGNLFYEFSPSLSMNLTIGIAHNPGAFFSHDVQSNATFFPSINLDYHPSKNFRISMSYISHPSLYYYPNNFFYPGWR